MPRCSLTGGRLGVRAKLMKALVQRWEQSLLTAFWTTFRLIDAHPQGS